MHVRTRLSLDHLDRMTDSTGLIQHAIYSIPRRESGYTTDDNARALRLCARLWGEHPDERMLSASDVLFELSGACPLPRPRVPQFPELPARLAGCGRDRRLPGPGGSAPWPKCSAAVCRMDYRVLARELIEAVLPALAELRSLRAQAYVILAWGHLWTAGVDDIEPLESVAWSRGEAAGGVLPPLAAAGLAVVRVADDLCQRRVAARPVRCGRALAARRRFSKSPSRRSPSSIW